MTLLDQALIAHRAGLCVMPPREDGSKAPEGFWKEYQSRTSSEEEVRRWYAGQRSGLGMLCGETSGFLEVLEFEGRAIAEGLWQAYKELAEASGVMPVLDRVMRGYGARSPSGGIHLAWRCPEGIEGNSKLARRPATPEELVLDPDEKVKVLIETRGEGGFVVTPPSNGHVHPSGGAYAWLAGGFESIVLIEAEDRAELLALARSFDQMPKEEWSGPTVFPVNPGAERVDDRPGDDFNARGDWAADVLEPAGWSRTGIQGGREYWYRKRDGRKGWKSAAVTADRRYLYVFSTSTELPSEVGLSKFRAYAFLHHEGDFAAAARQLRSEGYGKSTASLQLLPASSPPSTPAPTDGAHNGEPPPPAEEEEIDSSWRPVDLEAILRGDLTPLEPVCLTRQDGIRLLYPGRNHVFLGEPESCKSWAAQIAVAGCLLEGRNALYIDNEAEARDVIGHLRALGVDDQAMLAHLLYVRPDDPFDEVAQKVLFAALDKAPALYIAVIDGVNTSMVASGLDPNSNRDVAHWWSTLTRPVQRRSEGPTILVDHVAKDSATRGDWAVGAGQKKALVDGAMIAFQVESPFGVGLTGLVKMTLFKDRPGYLRGQQGTDKELAQLRLISEDGTVKHELLVPVGGGQESSEETGWRPTGYMERVSRALSEAPSPLSKNAIETMVSGKAKYIRTALEILTSEGYVEQVPGPRNSLLHRSIRPYLEEVPEEQC